MGFLEEPPADARGRQAGLLRLRSRAVRRRREAGIRPLLADDDVNLLLAATEHAYRVLEAGDARAHPGATHHRLDDTLDHRGLGWGRPRFRAVSVASGAPDASCELVLAQATTPSTPRDTRHSFMVSSPAVGEEEESIRSGLAMGISSRLTGRSEGHRDDPARTENVVRLGERGICRREI